MDLALNNLQRLIFHKTKQTKPIKDSPLVRMQCLHTNVSFSGQPILVGAPVGVH